MCNDYIYNTYIKIYFILFLFMQLNVVKLVCCHATCFFKQITSSTTFWRWIPNINMERLITQMPLYQQMRRGNN